MTKIMFILMLLLTLYSCDSVKEKDNKIKDGVYRAYVRAVNEEKSIDSNFVAHVIVKNGLIIKIMTSGKNIENFLGWTEISENIQNVDAYDSSTYMVYVIPPDFDTAN